MPKKDHTEHNFSATLVNSGKYQLARAVRRCTHRVIFIACQRQTARLSHFDYCSVAHNGKLCINPSAIGSCYLSRKESCTAGKNKAVERTLTAIGNGNTIDQATVN